MGLINLKVQFLDITSELLCVSSLCLYYLYPEDFWFPKNSSSCIFAEFHPWCQSLELWLSLLRWWYFPLFLFLQLLFLDITWPIFRASAPCILFPLMFCHLTTILSTCWIFRSVHIFPYNISHFMYLAGLILQKMDWWSSPQIHFKTLELSVQATNFSIG